MDRSHFVCLTRSFHCSSKCLGLENDNKELKLDRCPECIAFRNDQQQINVL